LILVTGGMKSGKSTFALNLALKYTKRAFLATGVPFDDEMRLRIEKHKAERKGLFDTFEEPVNVTEVLKNIDDKYDVILFECLTTYLGNLYYYQLDVQERIDRLVDVLTNIKCEVIIVTNEVGWGIIPENPTARQYAEMLGKTNTRLAKLAKEVYLVVSGIGVRIK